MKRIGVLGAVVLATAMFAQPAVAAPVSGNLSVVMNYLPNCGNNTADCTSLTAATGIDFITLVGTIATPSPGVPGVELVTDADGAFAPLLGMNGLIKDLSFSGAGTPNFPLPTVGNPILAWESIGNLTFDLLTVTVAFQDATALLLKGTGIFHFPGFDATAGTFTLSANMSGTTFSASASKGTVVPDAGSSLLLLTTALAGLAAARRRLQ